MELQIFVSLLVVLGAAFIALICDYLKGNNEQLREENIELLVRRDEQERRALLDPLSWIEHLRSAAEMRQRPATSFALQQEEQAVALGTQSKAKVSVERQETAATAEPMPARITPVEPEEVMKSWARGEELAKAAGLAATLAARSRQPVVEAENKDVAVEAPAAGLELACEQPELQKEIERVAPQAAVEAPQSQASQEQTSPLQQEVLPLDLESELRRVAKAQLQASTEAGSAGRPGGLLDQVVEASWNGDRDEERQVPQLEHVFLTHVRMASVAENGGAEETLLTVPVIESSLGGETAGPESHPAVAGDVALEPRTGEKQEERASAMEAVGVRVLPEEEAFPGELAPSPSECEWAGAGEVGATGETTTPVQLESVADRRDWTESAAAEIEPALGIPIVAPEGEAVATSEEVVVNEAPADAVQAVPEAVAEETIETQATSGTLDEAGPETVTRQLPALAEALVPAGSPVTTASEAAAQELEFVPLTEPETELLMPAGMHEAPVLMRLLDSTKPVSGIVVSICITDFPRLREAHSSEQFSDLIGSAGRLMNSLLRPDEFGARTSDDEWVLVLKKGEEGSSQKRISAISEKLWDFQLRWLGLASIMFSWGAVDVQKEKLSDALAAAREQTDQTRKGRKTVSINSLHSTKKAVNA